MDYCGVLEPKYHVEFGPELFKSVPSALGNRFEIILQCKSSFGDHFPLYKFQIWICVFTSSVKFRHLLINLGLGPPLKCSPGHDSMEDFSIIKSYRLKSRVTGLEHSKS